MILRNDLLAEGSTAGVEVIQLTSSILPSSHLYMEAQIFAPDSSRFLLHESTTAHGASKDDPNHRYLVCNLDNDCELLPLADEVGARAPSVTPDGKYVYYFVDETEINGGRFQLKRVGIDGTDRQTILVVDTPLPDVNRYASRLYPLSTIRSDARKIALSCFLGNGKAEGVLWGLMVFDLDSASVEVILQGQSWCNIHPQYCRSRAPEQMQDILVQENHGNICNASGQVETLVSGKCADIHVIKDDGSNFRNMPWGRDGHEFCQGHQCWRGTSEWAITSTSIRRDKDEDQLIEALAVPYDGHIGANTPGAQRCDLSSSFPEPCFFHFATDSAGKRLVTDTGKSDQGGRIFLADLPEPGTGPARSWRCLAIPRSSWQKEAHIHPFLSPDGTKAFFNSDESGTLQAYMIRGLENLK